MISLCQSNDHSEQLGMGLFGDPLSKMGYALWGIKNLYLRLVKAIGYWLAISVFKYSLFTVAM